MPAETVLEIRDLVKSYGAVQAVRGVSATIDRGEIVAVVGENGAGKSTIMRILAGIETADAGQIRIDGHPVEIRSPLDARALGISLAPQELTLCLDLTVSENILLGDLPANSGLLDRTRLKAEAQRRLDLLGTSGVPISAVVRELSFVERAFVQIARAMRADTRILIMDEPTAPMSQSEVDRLLSVLQGLASRGVAVLYISHRLEEVNQLASRAIVLRDGRIVGEFPREELSIDSLVAAMVGTPVSRSHADREERLRGALRLDVARAADEALADLSLQVHAHEIVGVYGVLGSGFEKLGGAIAQARTAPGGHVRVNGSEIPRDRLHQAIGAGLGYIPPERRAQGLHLGGSVAENLVMGMLRQLSRFGVLDKPAIRRTVRNWITELKIKTPSPHTEVGALSGGSQQKVLIARWLAAGSSVLLLEEPTRGVDIQTKLELYEVLRSKAQQGAAILVISSDLEEIIELSDRVLVVRGGVLAAEFDHPERTAVAAAALKPASMRQGGA